MFFDQSIRSGSSSGLSQDFGPRWDELLTFELEARGWIIERFMRGGHLESAVMTMIRQTDDGAKRVKAKHFDQTFTISACVDVTNAVNQKHMDRIERTLMAAAPKAR